MPIRLKTVEKPLERDFNCERIDRSQWIVMLENAVQSTANEADDHWRLLMKQLKLPLETFSAVVLAIQQGRWRNAKSPGAYIKTVARREALKFEPLPSDHGFVTLLDQPTDGRPFSFEDASDVLGLRESSEASKGNDGVWRRGSGRSDEYDDRDDDGYPLSDLPYREVLLKRLPKELKQIKAPSEAYKAAIDEWNRLTPDYHWHAKHSIHVSWDTWAIAANFDKWEHVVLLYTLQGTSREKALASQPTDEKRKALQAAWKRFDRNGRKRLEEAANKLKKNVPEVAKGHTT
jgi:hypothetical protein